MSYPASRVEPPRAMPSMRGGSPLQGGVAPLTAVLIGLSIAAGIWTRLGKAPEAVEKLLISAYAMPDHSLPEVRQGQVWRLLTPIFVHFGPLHIIFNLLWLKDLGSLLERRLSAGFLLAFTVGCGVLSNLAQFWFGGPGFGGMSGVVYGLLGFTWLWSTTAPRHAGLALNQQTVMMMLIWFVLCWTGLLGPIANYAHTAGLLVGVVWGYLYGRAVEPRRARA